MNQLTIFDVLEALPVEPVVEPISKIKNIDSKFFTSESAKWNENNMCEVIVNIPKSMQSPTERRKFKIGSQGWLELQEIWGAHVMAIARTIPYEKRPKDDINGWGIACDLFVEHRNSNQPIKLEISKRDIVHFAYTEVKEYLQ